MLHQCGLRIAETVSGASPVLAGSCEEAESQAPLRQLRVKDLVSTQSLHRRHSARLQKQQCQHAPQLVPRLVLARLVRNSPQGRAQGPNWNPKHWKTQSAQHPRVAEELA
jgi:hypothetical protein